MTTRLDKLLALGLTLGGLLLLALLAEGAWVAWRYQQAQRALDQVALAASAAIDETLWETAGILDLRWEAQAGRPSVYAVAQAELERRSDGALRITTLVSDGAYVIVTGTLTAPTFLLRALGWPTVQLTVLSRAALVY